MTVTFRKRTASNYYRPDQVEVRALHTTRDGRRYVVYDTILDSFNVHTGLTVEPVDAGFNLYFEFAPLAKGASADAPEHRNSPLSAWPSIVGQVEPLPAVAATKLTQFVKVPANGRLFIAAGSGEARELAV